MRPPRTPGRRDGLTLVEIIIASAVLAVLLLGLFATMNISQKSDSLSRERNAAAEVAFMELDKLMGTNIDELPASGSFEVRYDTGRVDAATGLPVTAALRVADPYPFTRPTGFNAAHAGQIVIQQNPPIDRANATPTCGVDVFEIRITVAWRPADWDPIRNPQISRIDVVTRRVRGT